MKIVIEKTKQDEIVKEGLEHMFDFAHFLNDKVVGEDNWVAHRLLGHVLKGVEEVCKEKVMPKGKLVDEQSVFQVGETKVHKPELTVSNEGRKDEKDAKRL